MFDADLKMDHDDTGSAMTFPEQEEGYRDNPIRILFEGTALEGDEDED